MENSVEEKKQEPTQLVNQNITHNITQIKNLPNVQAKNKKTEV